MVMMKPVSQSVNLQLLLLYEVNSHAHKESHHKNKQTKKTPLIMSSEVKSKMHFHFRE